ncbi:hypothetical protein GYMLUDRAFT_247680 [Collybiopsis luxurians FD-317 M1]|uniref:Uncharacterized protein n=1 Tax=Collybiopsis luxurians FD-317 M1 TaxID=944289 RepID=A0A0D0CN17_9AGAR|nr:hypothetical protein GYMLUDRAFT_247680 [Collybiopsis luxurians FD-317 M1]
MPFHGSWEETDKGFAEDTPLSVLVRTLRILCYSCWNSLLQLSDEVQTQLRTKFLWHFAPTYLMVRGTEYKKDFWKLAVAIYAAHWPEDIACGTKQTRHTCLSKRVVSPDNLDTSDWNQKPMPPWYDSKDEAKALERNRLIRGTLYSFYKSNNSIYQHSLAQCSKDEARQLQYGLSKAI